MSDEGQRVVRFNRKHYDLLMKCSKKGDMTEWNKWYEEYMGAPWDTGEKDCGAWLEGADLKGAHMEEAHLLRAHLERADMSLAHLEGADMSQAHLEGTNMCGANMNGTDMSLAHLEKATMLAAHLRGAGMFRAYLNGADMRWVHLEGADMSQAHLEGADMSQAHLEGTSFYAAWLNEKTDLLGCTYDTTTDFTATAITVTRINPNTLTDLQYNIRRKQWEEWYELPKIHAVVSVLKERYKNSWIPKMIKSVQKFITYQPRRVQENISSNKTVDVADGTDKTREKPRKASFFDRVFVNTPVRMFWRISDYGRSTVRIIGVFFGVNLLFTFIYLFLSSITLQFMPQTDPIFNETTSFPMALMQSNMIVFSITDVATRGLNELSMFFVLLHIIIGYVLLAALVTRFAIMFQSVGR